MKKIAKLHCLLVTIIFFAFANNLFAQATESSKDYAEFIFYRPSQSVMSGGAGVEIKLFMNDQEVETLFNGVMLKYKMYSEGDIKIKTQGYMSGGAVGGPWVNTITVKHGEVYHIKLESKFPSGIVAEILEGKKLAKMEKNKWSDVIEKVESKDNPLIN
ncbi:MAG: hypothetical protein LBH92_07240 [Bacteroidales bacterium]|jgi:hypothetical protein|nr:hypothetical protein [Bacteroidales bacterium]